MIRRPAVVLALWTVGVVTVGAGVFALLDVASVHWVAANSDGATIVLQGQSMRSGSILLSGWSLPLDSFFTTEVPFYAIADALVGLGHGLVNAVPAVIASVVVLVAVALAARPGRGSTSLAGAAFVVALLALPSPALSYFFLQGPWHVGTALACLVAFAGASSGRFDARAALAVLALTLGLLGDVQILALGVVPVLLGGVVGSCRARSLRVLWPPSAIALSSVVLAYGLRKLADAVGTFTLVGANPTARLAEVGINFRHLPSRFAGLFGVGTVPIGPDTTASRFAVVHAIALAVVLVGFAGGLFSLFRGAILGDARQHL
ncbi:MAG TPA: hypothetical protein VG368_02540, partial [Acidimicrobiales bacterium]|nr:hypothetical protein [Acidimicrobiales bacterium]